MTLNSTNPAPFYRQIFYDIRTKIKTGKLLPGSRIPPHIELAKNYNVSLITVKKALEELIRDGYLYARVGKGTFVTDSDNINDYRIKQSIGLVLTDFTNPFFLKIARHIETVIPMRGFNLIFSYSSNDFEREENQIRYFQEIGVKGLIIASTEHANHVPDIVRQLHNEHFPYVMISYVDDPEIHYTGTDHYLGAFMAAECLIKSGKKRLAYVGARKNNPLCALRRNGFLSAAKKYGCDYFPEFEFYFPSGKKDYESGFDAGEKFFRLAEKPDGIFAFNDQTAIGFQQALIHQGISIPEDVSLVGFDNIISDMPVSVKLTTINQPADDIAEITLDKLNCQIEGKPFEKRTILQPALIVRESCILPDAEIKKSFKASS